MKTTKADLEAELKQMCSERDEAHAECEALEDTIDVLKQQLKLAQQREVTWRAAHRAALEVLSQRYQDTELLTEERKQAQALKGIAKVMAAPGFSTGRENNE
jgi:hypothetical protein